MCRVRRRFVRVGGASTPGRTSCSTVGPPSVAASDGRSWPPDGRSRLSTGSLLVIVVCSSITVDQDDELLLETRSTLDQPPGHRPHNGPFALRSGGHRSLDTALGRPTNWAGPPGKG